MLTTAIFPSRYVQGNGAFNHLGEELARFGKRTLALLDPFADDHLGAALDKACQHQLECQRIRFNGECSDEEVARLAGVARQHLPDSIVGIGGGKSLDTAKALAHELNIPVAVVPTLASTDAPCSALSVIYTAEGAFKRYLFLPRNPDLVLVDTGIIAQAPARFLVSGMGDAMATWFEAEDCRIRGAGNMTGRPGPLTAYALARLCYDTLLEYGPLALHACQQQVVTPAGAYRRSQYPSFRTRLRKRRPGSCSRDSQWLHRPAPDPQLLARREGCVWRIDHVDPEWPQACHH